MNGSNSPSDDLLTRVQARSAELSENLWAEGDESLLAEAASEIERLTLELRVSSQQAGELRDDRARLRVTLGNIVSYSMMENSKAMEWIREAARNALTGGAT